MFVFISKESLFYHTMEDMRHRHLMVVSLVFGTTKSGSAVSMIHEFNKDPLNIHLHKMWNRVFGTSTCLLLDKEKQFEAFGDDAEDRYDELVMDEEHANYYFFDRFTMSLHNNEVFHLE